MRLGDFSDEAEPEEEKPSSSPNKKELEEALARLHREFLRVDTLLRNLPDNK